MEGQCGFRQDNTGRGGFGAPGVASEPVKERVLRLWRFLQTPQGLKMVRYTMVSLVSALTSLVLLTITYGILRLGTEVVCTLISNILAGFPSYYLNRRWVWKKGGRSHVWREVLPFWVMSITGIGFALYTASLRTTSRTHTISIIWLAPCSSSERMSWPSGSCGFSSSSS